MTIILIVKLDQLTRPIDIESDSNPSKPQKQAVLVGAKGESLKKTWKPE
jgi:hypothetical protein